MEHIEIIKCPQCGKVQKAKVLQSIPFWIYIHKCEKCKYKIMESEWEVIKNA